MITPDVSIVIPSYNQPATVQRCLHSLLEQEFSGIYEIVIADSSDAEKQQALADFCEPLESVRLVRLDRQTYPGAARNVGIKAARANYIALIDSDCVAGPQWLANVWRHRAPDTILTGVIENGTPQSAYGTCSFLVEFNHFLDFQGDPRPVHAAATCNFACDKATFEQVGYFTDDRAFEDMLFCKKFTDRGGRILRYPDIRITHLNKTDRVGVRNNQRMLGFYSAKVRKAHGMPPGAVFDFPILAFALILFRYLSIASRVIKTKHFWNFLFYKPILLYLLWYWARGFRAGAVVAK